MYANFSHLSPSSYETLSTNTISAPLSRLKPTPYVDAPPYGTIDKREREGRARERQQAAVDTTTYFAYTGGILRGLKLLAGGSPTGLSKRDF